MPRALFCQSFFFPLFSALYFIYCLITCRLHLSQLSEDEKSTPTTASGGGRQAMPAGLFARPGRIPPHRRHRPLPLARLPPSTSHKSPSSASPCTTSMSTCRRLSPPLRSVTCLSLYSLTEPTVHCPTRSRRS